MSDPYRQIGRITFGPASSTGEQQGAYATCVTAAGVAAAARTVGTLEAENAQLRAELAAAMQWNADAKRVMAEMRDSTLIIRERDEARAELAAARAALAWYGAEARAIAKNMQATPPKPFACEASLVVLSLDAGMRADDALAKKDAP